MDTGKQTQERVMPDKEEEKLPFVMKKYKTELKQYYFKKERYKEHKAKIFVNVKEQSGEPKGPQFDRSK